MHISKIFKKNIFECHLYLKIIFSKNTVSFGSQPFLSKNLKMSKVFLSSLNILSEYFRSGIAFSYYNLSV